MNEEIAVDPILVPNLEVRIETRTPLLLLLDEVDDPEKVKALRFILETEMEQRLHSAGSGNEGKQVAVEGILVSKNDDATNQVSTHVKGRTKKTTPERIRERASKLYDEIHDLIDQYNIRKQREKELSLGLRPMSLEALNEGTRARPNLSPLSSMNKSKSPAESPRPISREARMGKLPDLRQSFQEARQKYLEVAEEEKLKRPLERPPRASSKDPSTFSHRFQLQAPVEPTGVQ